MKENNQHTKVKILDDGTPVKLENKVKKSSYIKKNKIKKYISKINGKYIYPYRYIPVKKGPYFSSGKPKKMYIKNGKYSYKPFFGPPPPVKLLSPPEPRLLLPSPVLPVLHGQRGPIPYGYYYRNGETIKQKQKDRRLAFNKTLPPLNLTCTYCNKPFILPGMKENGHKQKPVKHCSYLCHKREERLRKLWIPKWLYNFYLEKKLWRLIISFKQSKHSIFSSKRQLLGLKNLNFHNFFILWHPNSFLRKKYKWIDKLVKKYQNKRRLKWLSKYQKTDKFRLQIRNWQKRQPKDSNFKIAGALRASIVGALKRQGIRKCRRTDELLGTDKVTARNYLEALFEPGMTWQNHGQWHIDHKIPCASFDLRCPVQQLACCYYKNLQPLWAIDNIKKGAKIKYGS
jgi:hypothetical protein